MRIEEALSADLRVMDTISRNAANVTTDGYRRARPTQVFRTQFDNASAAADPVQTTVESRPGALRLTGSTLDFAIEGDAYFEVEGPNGALYTRNGGFHLTANGELVTSEGYPVVGSQGPIVVSQGFELGAAGEIFDQGQSVGRFKLMSPLDPRSVQAAGDTYVTLGQADESSSAMVRQGFKEASNVELLQEMIGLIDVSRHFGMVQRLVVTRDALVNESIRKIGQF